LNAVLAGQRLVVFELEGRLGPMVGHPEVAGVRPTLTKWLEQLAQRLPMAIITGRGVADVTPRLNFKPHYVIGNHGAEDPSLAPPAVADAALDALRERIAMHPSELQRAGVQVEDKQYSLTLHYRQAPDHGAALLCIEALLQGIEPALKRFGGKCVVNVVASGLPDKGDALASLVRRSGAGSAVFVGDDVNDESVFIGAEPHWLTVRIGRDDPLSKAMFFLDSDTELAAVLQRMLELLGARGTAVGSA
jgi:trehalose 6-phosphate phosphatase